MYYEEEEEYIPRRLRRFYRRKKKAEKKEKKGAGLFGFLFGKTESKEEKKISKEEKMAARKKAEIERILAEMKWKAKLEMEERMANEIFEQILEAKKKVPKEKEKYEQARAMTVKELREFRRKYKRLPQKDEYEAIAEAVVEQLKAPPHKIKEILEEEKKKLEKEKEEVLKKVEVKEEKAEEKPKKKEAAELLEMPELEVGKEAEGISELEELGGMEEIGELEGMEELGEEGLEEIAPLEEEKEANVCPKCKKPALKLIYCPKCGNAFCDSCAKERKETPVAVEYVCPHCGYRFKKKK